jgi:hypothetical protein
MVTERMPKSGRVWVVPIHEITSHAADSFRANSFPGNPGQDRPQDCPSTLLECRAIQRSGSTMSVWLWYIW